MEKVKKEVEHEYYFYDGNIKTEELYDTNIQSRRGSLGVNSGLISVMTYFNVYKEMKNRPMFPWNPDPKDYIANYIVALDEKIIEPNTYLIIGRVLEDTDDTINDQPIKFIADSWGETLTQEEFLKVYDPPNKKHGKIKFGEDGKVKEYEEQLIDRRK